jgi:hypothetical protein
MTYLNLAFFLLGAAAGGVIGYLWKRREIQRCGSIVVRESENAAGGQIQFTRDLFEIAKMDEVRLKVIRKAVQDSDLSGPGGNASGN